MNRSNFSETELQRLIFVDLTVDELMLICVRLNDYIRRLDKEIDRKRISKQLIEEKETKADKLESIVEQIEAAIKAQLYLIN